MRPAFLGAAMGAAMIVSGGAAGAVTEQNFLLKTSADLVALCSPHEGDPNGVAAIHFCQGYLTGLYHYNEAVGRVFRGINHCPPDTYKPTRNEGVSILLAWAERHPDQLSEPPLDGMLLALKEKWPCPPTAGSEQSGGKQP